MTTATPTLCPTPDRLAQLVSGSLIEAEADRLFGHIDRCTSCQLQVDELARQKDPVFKAAVFTADGRSRSKATQDERLSSLIQTAQKCVSADDTQRQPQSKTRSISAVDFVKGLRRSGLIGGDELSQVLNDLSWDDNDPSGDSGRLARALIQNQKLTPFQAKLLLRGRWKGLVLGNYAILDKLGQGGMGSVFVARHTKMGRTVCLKVVNAAGRQSPEVIDRFRNEARALAALSHPNIVVAHDADEAKGIPYLVMEYVDGEDLAKQVRKQGKLRSAIALEIGIQTARALRYAHAKGVIHRDIKPHNIVSKVDPATGKVSVKVLDLGLARFDTLITDNPDASVLAAMTNTGVVIGTVDYMAPEQALDSRNADARSDVYGLGCTLFFLLAARPPFSGETVMQRLIAHREQVAPDLSVLVEDVSPDLDAVIHKMLAKHPSDRYQTMDQVLADLEAVLRGHAPSVQPTAASESGRWLDSTSGNAAMVGTEASSQSLSRELSRLKPADDKRLPFRLGLRHRFVAGVAATALVIFAAIYFALPPGERLGSDSKETAAPLTPPPRVGAAQAIRNGGAGRALVLVSSKQFREQEFVALAQVLADHDVNLVVASSKYGTGQAEASMELRDTYPNLNLSDVDATAFDSIFILGGDNHELSHKNPKAQRQVIRIVEQALQNDVIVSGCTEGFHTVLRDTGLISKREYNDQSYKFDLCSAQELETEASRIFTDLKGQPRPAAKPRPLSPSETSSRR